MTISKTRKVYKDLNKRLFDVVTNHKPENIQLKNTVLIILSF